MIANLIVYELLKINKMNIKRITIDKRYFQEDIKHCLKQNGVKKKQILNITEDENFTTLWYWTY